MSVHLQAGNKPLSGFDAHILLLTEAAKNRTDIGCLKAAELAAAALTATRVATKRALENMV